MALAEGDGKLLQLQDFKGKVQRVVVDGLNRTKDDLIIKAVQPLFQAKNLHEISVATHAVKTRLQKLELFKRIGVAVDTSKGHKARPDGYDVVFIVEENRRINAHVRTEMGTNEAEFVIGAKSPNLFGRGETVNGGYSFNPKYGMTADHSSYHFGFKKPLRANPDLSTGFGLYKSGHEFTWSGYKEMAKGINLNFTFPSVLGKHTLQWDGVWRDLRASSRTTSFAVRENSGHTIKSSLKHVLERDKRDHRILPSKGTFIRLIQEYAGLGGNVEYVKNDMELQFNKKFILDTVLQLSLAGGIMRSLNPTREIRINDRFFLGGPLSLRGFNIKGVGPHSDGNALGADAYWLCALHMYTPLPFRPGKGGFGELFRTHFFVNAGNLGNIDLNKTIKENCLQLSETFRMSYGAGVVLIMGRIARLELNYVVPVKTQPGDSVNPGIQFGIGMEFL